MPVIVAEFSYSERGSNFNLQGMPYAVMQNIAAYLGDHYGPRGIRNVLVYCQHGRSYLMVVANSRLTIVTIGRSARPQRAYITHAQRMQWTLLTGSEHYV